MATETKKGCARGIDCPCDCHKTKYGGCDEPTCISYNPLFWNCGCARGEEHTCIDGPEWDQ